MNKPRCRILERLLDAIQASSVTDLTFANNDAGFDKEGIGKLLRTKQVKTMTSSYVGENKDFRGEKYVLAPDFILTCQGCSASSF